ncbi:hypothetical protein EJD88_17410 [Pseudomonas sp. PB105]|uniref:hypothetical protein n=1 Tax=Pseudomonas TaxID=286 RepID=UPI000C14BA79|nr:MULTISPECIES: hypothetical protein [Pseudomonas]KAE9652055.1 hypothetical protein EJD88_17410 [Pseudomonas sp. PB105]MBD8240178.1 hypothetical protein [Pseudomonas fluorescens]MCM2363728.1 hypothetical protein [Pseudomonas sp. SR18]MDY0896912.1 hypothetical protein [Pseudomonas fluorescens]MVW93894.1 hypothetical protein [Pseudomonas sp. PB100]
MKSQDVLILFKLISLELQARGERVKKREFSVMQDSEGAVISTIKQFFENENDIQAVQLSDLEDWRGWDESEPAEQDNQQSYSVRALASALGLSKTEVSSSLSRCREIGLVFTDNNDGSPLVRKKALLDLVTYSIRYIFPVKPGPIVRGIPTAFAAPILAGKVISGGEFIPVWPDAYGKSKGQEITPLYKTVPGAVKKDELLYHFLALVDAIRIGGPREAKVADAMLREWIL